MFYIIKYCCNYEKWWIAFSLKFIDICIYDYCCRCYYSLDRGSSCTGPTAVDREQNTITDVAMIFILDQGMIPNSSQSG